MLVLQKRVPMHMGSLNSLVKLQPCFTGLLASFAGLVDFLELGGKAEASLGMPFG